MTDEIKITDGPEVLKLLKTCEKVLIDYRGTGNGSEHDLKDLEDYRYVFDIILTKKVFGNIENFKIHFYALEDDPLPVVTVTFESSSPITCPYCDGKGEFPDESAPGEYGMEHCYFCDRTGKITVEQAVVFAEQFRTDIVRSKFYLDDCQRKLDRLTTEIQNQSNFDASN